MNRNSSTRPTPTADFILRGKTALVTGGTGLLGGALSRRLLAEGASVRVLARNPDRGRALAALGAQVVRGDMTSSEPLKNAVAGCSLVFHFAGVLASEARPRSWFQRVNVEGTRVLAEQALLAGVDRLIHCSTAWVYGFDAGSDTDERSSRHPSRDNYCDTKLESEAVVLDLVRTRGLPAVVVQPTEVYGLNDESWTLGPIRLARSGRLVLPAGGRGVIQPIYIDDAVEGILAAARRGRIGESYLVAGPSVVTIRDFFGSLAALAGAPSPPSVPGWLALGLATLSEWWARLLHRPPVFTRGAVRGTLMRASYSGSKARAELGFVARTDLDKGLGAVREWLPPA